MYRVWWVCMSVCCMPVCLCVRVCTPTLLVTAAGIRCAWVCTYCVCNGVRIVCGTYVLMGACVCVLDLYVYA